MNDTQASGDAKRHGLWPRSKSSTTRLAVEQAAHVGRASPQRRRRGERRRGRQVAAQDLEELADQALGGPVDEADAPAGTADAGTARAPRSRGAARTARRRPTARGRSTSSSYGSSSASPSTQSTTTPAAAARALRRLEQLGREVEADDLRAGGGGADREVAGAGGDVEHLAGPAGCPSARAGRAAGPRRCGGRRRRNHRRPRWHGARA